MIYSINMIRNLAVFKIILIFGFLASGFVAKSDEFSEKQKAIIYNEAIKILKNYQDYSNHMADAVTNIDELNKLSQRLIDQFVSRKAIIYNDLDPAHKLSEAYELETYVANILLWYPDGMKIYLDFDNLRAGNIISHGNDIYTVDILTSKKIDGNYLNKQQNTNSEELLYRIAFFKKANGFDNYKIAGVRSTKATAVADDSKLLAEVKSVSFSDKDMQLIKDQTKSLLNDYINFLNLMTDPKETEEDKFFYKVSFVGLFKDSTLNVANDIEPDPQSRWISIADYQKKIIASYPEGIRNIGLNIDSAEYGKVVADGKEKFYINGYIDKFFSGKYLSKNVFRDNSKYDFKVSFERDENTFKNFKLTSIDKFGVNLYQTTANTPQELPQKPITRLKRNGIYVGLSAGGGLTKLNDPNMTGNTTLPWKLQGKSAVNIEAFATWYLLNRIGLKLGVEYSKYSVNTNLTGEFQNNTLFVDVNDLSYYKQVKASYDSLFTYNTLSIPISIVLHSNSNPEKWGLYLDFGMIVSKNLNSKYKTTGSMETLGYYPYETDPLLQLIENAPEYGFVKRTNINNSGTNKTPNLFFSMKASLGISYPINYFTTIHIGSEFIWDISSIMKDKTYTDAYGATSSAKKVGLSKYGIKFGISYKF